MTNVMTGSAEKQTLELDVGLCFVPLDPEAKDKDRAPSGWIQEAQAKVKAFGAFREIAVRVFEFDEGQILFRNDVAHKYDSRVNQYNSHAQSTASVVNNAKNGVLPGFTATCKSTPDGHTILVFVFNPIKEHDDLSARNTTKEQ